MSTSVSSRPVVSVEGLAKSYGQHCALRGLDLAIEEAEVYGLVGLNGAGKTTLLRCLVGFSRPSSGRAIVMGHDMRSHAGQVLRHVGVLIEEAAFYPFLSGRRNLAALAELSGRKKSVDVDSALSWVGLSAAGNRRVGGYSKGMRQRLGLAAALLFDPRLVILDEPAEGLDPQGIADIRSAVRALHASGKTVIFSSHDLDEVEQIATRVGVVHRGRLVAEGSPSELREQVDSTMGSDQRAGDSRNGLEEAFLHLISGGRA